MRLPISFSANASRTPRAAAGALLPILFCAAAPSLAVPLTNGLGGPAGFGEHTLGPVDDESVEIDLQTVFGADGLNVFGTSYTSLWLDSNGTVSFGDDEYYAYDPDDDLDELLDHEDGPVIAPFHADIDTDGELRSAPTPGGTSTGSNRVWYDLDPLNATFTATWDDVAPYNEGSLYNAFQLALIGSGGGDFVAEFRYESLEWSGQDDNGTSGTGPFIGVYDGSGSLDGVSQYPFSLDREATDAALVGGSAPSAFGYSFAEGTPSQLVPTSAVPEPTQLALLGAGLLGLVAARRRRRV